MLKKKTSATADKPPASDPPADMPPADKPREGKPPESKAALRLRKLANLQGFVTETQIREAAQSDDEFDLAKDFIMREGITVNPFVKEIWPHAGDKKPRSPNPSPTSTPHGSTCKT